MLQVSINKKLEYFDLDVDFQVADNQIMVLWGPSGSGKTTVLECLAGLRTPTRGRIELAGKTLYSSEEKTNIAARDRRVGYLFQDYALFPHMTVKQNVLYGLHSIKKHCTEKPNMNYEMLLESFGILHLIDRFPGQLSGGEKQRAAMVRALVVQPNLLLLDEPFSALDRQSKQKLRLEMKGLHENWQVPMVLVTHDEEDAIALGDIIISLHQGQVVERKFAPKRINKTMKKPERMRTGQTASVEGETGESAFSQESKVYIRGISDTKAESFLCIRTTN